MEAWLQIWQVVCTSIAFKPYLHSRLEVWCPAKSAIRHETAAALFFNQAGEHLRSKVGDMGAQDIVLLGGFPQLIL